MTLIPDSHSLGIFFILTLLATNQVNALDDGEVSALKDMQAEWGTQLGWTGSPSCLWFGVHCDSNGNVILLFLYDNQLSGTIPSSIGNLAQLQALYLDDNQLSGTIPSSIGTLTHLGYLYLYNNSFSGVIPQALCPKNPFGIAIFPNNGVFTCPLPTCCVSSSCSMQGFSASCSTYPQTTQMNTPYSTSTSSSTSSLFCCYYGSSSLPAVSICSSSYCPPPPEGYSFFSSAPTSSCSQCSIAHD